MTPRDDSFPSVHRFLDAREFLRAAYEARRRADRSFSQRRIALALKAGSSSFFRDILAGKSRLTPARVAGFAKLFKLSPDETARFGHLVAYTLAESGEEKTRALARLEGALPAGRRSLLGAYHAEYFGKWHYAAVRELLALHDFRGDYEALGRLLDPPLSAVEARDAVRLLHRLKLVRKTPHGGYAPTDKVLLSGPENTPGQMRAVLREHTDLARRALETHDPDIRPFLYATVGVSDATVREVRARMRAFQREILALAADDPGADRLYQLNLQLHPLSGSVKRETR